MYSGCDASQFGDETDAAELAHLPASAAQRSHQLPAVHPDTVYAAHGVLKMRQVSAIAALAPPSAADALVRTESSRREARKQQSD